MGPLLAIAASIAALAGAGSQPSIVGGSPASGAHVQSLALVTFEGAGTTRECSGTLVAPDLVLSAGHCVEGGRPGDYEVSLGARRGQGARFRSAVSRIVLVPGYQRRTLAHDAALLVLARRAPGPVQPLTARTPAPGEVGGIVGWGEHEVVQLEAQSGPREARAAIQQAATCAAASLELSLPFFADSESCTLSGARDSGACHGDSGGPLLLADGSQAAIVSHGDGNCSTNVPTFFTDLPLAWITGWRTREAAPRVRPGLHRLRIPGGTALVSVAADGEHVVHVSAFARLRCASRYVRLHSGALSDWNELALAGGTLRVRLAASVGARSARLRVVLALGRGAHAVYLGASRCRAAAR